MAIFLQSLKKLSESSSLAKYAYSYIGNQPVPKKHFADNCNKLATDIEKAASKGTRYQQELLRSVARHVKNQNVSLAQDILDKTDSDTRNIIPKIALDFIRRNS